MEPTGAALGAPVGAPVSALVGAPVGEAVGASVGTPVGAPVGEAVGFPLGAALPTSSIKTLSKSSPSVTSTVPIIFGSSPPSLSVTSAKPGRLFSINEYTPGATTKVKFPAASVKAVATTLPSEAKSLIGTLSIGESPSSSLSSSSSTCPSMRRSCSSTKSFPGEASPAPSGTSMMLSSGSPPVSETSSGTSSLLISITT
mmetsp:Transcript_20857/g.30935  ORF Transcript_20857/g.30935 Transcript_20857/m.30935 type:complete len:200 (+) Transcript_20857:242-841(+)